jgi:hypothetical protein
MHFIFSFLKIILGIFDLIKIIFRKEKEEKILFEKNFSVRSIHASL